MLSLAAETDTINCFLERRKSILKRVKKTLLQIVGRTGYWLGWPVLYVYIKGTMRSRVVVLVDDKILVTKSWLGDGKWELPGGGTHKGETIVACAIREVEEETGIELTTEQLVQGESFDISNNGMPFTCWPLFVRLQSRPTTVLPKREVVELDWVLADSLSQNNTEAASLRIIADFRRQNLL